MKRNTASKCSKEPKAPKTKKGNKEERRPIYNIVCRGEVIPTTRFLATVQ